MSIRRKVSEMRKIITLLLTALFITAIGLAGCTAKQPQPIDYTNLTHNTTIAKTATATINPSVTPSITPSPGPTTVTGSFGESSYFLTNGTVITATVSNWQSNPNIEIGDTAHAQTVSMQSTGNGGYTYTLEGVTLVPSGRGQGGITLLDNGVIVASATTTWINPSPTPLPTKQPTQISWEVIPVSSHTLEGSFMIVSNGKSICIDAPVNVYVYGHSYGTATPQESGCVHDERFSFSIAPGEYQVTLDYPGSAQYEPSTTTAMLHVV